MTTHPTKKIKFFDCRFNIVTAPAPKVVTKGTGFEGWLVDTTSPLGGVIVSDDGNKVCKFVKREDVQFIG